MKRKGLYFLIALALGGVGAVHAQDAAAPADTASSMTSPSYDGRWYIAPTVGGYYNDTDRNTNSRQIYYGLGVGRFISSNTSIDIFVDRTKRDADGGGSWSNNSVGAAVRFYAGDWNAWRPYLLAGVMGSNHHGVHGSGWSPAAELGGGLSKTIDDSSDFRVEAGYRYDWDNDSQPTMDGYGDWFLGFSIVSRFGAPAAAPAAPVAATPPPADCSTMDSDSDGVNDCEDKCPATAAGTIVGPDGCAQKVVIDLRGVNFKFDRPKKGETDISKSLAEPSADSIAVLNQAVDTLQRYPQVKVTVAGYTDSKGTDEYNQSLSERRASIVYNYLTSHGIDASRLEGPIGHGESNPIGDNETDAGRAQNRRTELQVQQ
ncbi:Outer membrane protein OmpA and related peptidoglycan-associated (lipo)proteins [Rhodanobacter sp. Root179]|jgi:OOP family OmpA-OmpF porin|uniref:OmpA family protein n=1 Tax=unclassified Rhodanobacter TaxID=2621553 RepID=UPI0007009BCA|nr:MULTISPECIES: OmpA family protein [unclassified Rhodanobacter]KQZ77566.1 flagellar motor protein MotB [Rhodanobacter sp. Root561]KRB41081.1 flagellar motor protein MotB [Rhodanobacter sp. Root179]QRP62355.1 OmpA family protein [Rhodanobacter sp. FDAARGOS 1247]